MTKNSPFAGLGAVSLLDPIPLRRLNTALIILQPEVSEVILEAKSYIAGFFYGSVGVVLVEIS
jgi:hypothetical protein